jgi:hypothetical protein
MICCSSAAAVLRFNLAHRALAEPIRISKMLGEGQGVLTYQIWHFTRICNFLFWAHTVVIILMASELKL